MISQAFIAIFGLTAIYMSQARDPRLKKAACLFGMASQPFWIYSTVSAQMWGMLALTVCYTFVWGVGIYNNWLRKEK